MRSDYLNDFNLIFNEAIIANNDDKTIVWNEIIKDLIPYKLSLDKNSIYFFDTQGNWYFELKKNGDLWCSYRLVWSVFENEFDMRYNDIQFLIKKLIEEEFKQEVITPMRLPFGWWRRVEEAFKEEVTIPVAPIFTSSLLAEKALKEEVIIPKYEISSIGGWLEEVFKREVITPTHHTDPYQKRLEEVFKQDGITPIRITSGVSESFEEVLKQEVIKSLQYHIKIK